VLGVLLDKPGVLAAAGDVPEVWVRQPVVEPESEIELTLELPTGVSAVQGELRVVRRREAEAILVQTLPVTYSGPNIDHLTVVFAAPALAGAYTLEFSSSAWPGIATTELFVQNS
jgi:hypothetical protein